MAQMGVISASLQSTSPSPVITVCLSHHDIEGNNNEFERGDTAPRVNYINKRVI